MSRTLSWGPVRAAMPANCAAALTQEWQFTARRVALSTRSGGHTP